MANPSKIRHLLAVGIVGAVVLIVTTLVLNAPNRGGKDASLPALPRNVELSLSNVHYTEVKGDTKQWDLFAEKGEYDRSRDLTLLSAVKLVLPGDKKSGEIVLRANQAEYFNATKDVLLQGNVAATSVSGMAFSTQKAFYRSASAEVTTDNPVHFSDERLTVEGVGMVLNVKTKDVKILRDVRATVRPDKKG